VIVRAVALRTSEVTSKKLVSCTLSQTNVVGKGPSVRSYGESCGIAHAFDLIGDRWAAMIVRELLLGPQRFTDLNAALLGASPSVLSDRLRALVDRGIVLRRSGPPPGRGQLYQLTPWGRLLRPILAALGDWALASPGMDRAAPLSDDAAALALATHFVDQDPDWNADFELRIGRGVFLAEIRAGRLEMERGAARHPAAVLTTEARRFVAMLGPQPRRSFSQDDATGDVDGLNRLLCAARFPSSS
jgi:DNA-binding HxlR family transcriptional regulator